MSADRPIVRGIVICPVKGEIAAERCYCLMLSGFRPCESCWATPDMSEAIWQGTQRHAFKRPRPQGAHKGKMEVEDRDKDRKKYLKAKRDADHRCIDCGKLISKKSERCRPCSIKNMKLKRPRFLKTSRKRESYGRR